MTKNWDAVRGYIEEYSVTQKMSLEDVMAMMQRKHSFKASTRAYRLKYKEWGFLRHKPHRSRRMGESARRVQASDGGLSDSTSVRTSVSSGKRRHAVHSTPQSDVNFNDMDRPRFLILQAVCTGDLLELENQLRTAEGRSCLNYPLGDVFEPSDAHHSPSGGLARNRLSVPQGCVLPRNDPKHPSQTLLDIASALPHDVIVRRLLYAGARSSVDTHGTQFSMSNAIRNGRVANVEALLQNGACKARGLPGCTMVPIRQAAFYLSPPIIQHLLDHGADVNPYMDVGPHKTAVQLAIDRRASAFLDEETRSKAEKTIMLLLDAGATILLDRQLDPDGLTPFESFIKPWISDPLWATHPTPLSSSILRAFIAAGADLNTPFAPSPSSCTRTYSQTISHHLLYHAPTHLTQLLMDAADVLPGGNGATLLHCLIVSCPAAPRHPATVLRDIEVLLARGADPNLVALGSTGHTPLTACLALCPALEVLERVRLLLRGGADPGLLDAQGFDPVLMAAKGFTDSLRFQLVELLIQHYKPTHASLPGSRSWIPSCLHLGSSGEYDHSHPATPTSSNNSSLSHTYGPMGKLAMQLPRTLPADIRDAIRTAAFSVASRRIIDNAVKMGVAGCEYVLRTVRLRERAGLPAYEFAQGYVCQVLEAAVGGVEQGEGEEEGTSVDGMGLGMVGYSRELGEAVW